MLLREQLSKNIQLQIRGRESVGEMNALTRLSVKSEMVIIAPSGRDSTFYAAELGISSRLVHRKWEINPMSQKLAGLVLGRTANISIYRKYKT